MLRKQGHKKKIYIYIYIYIYISYACSPAAIMPGKRGKKGHGSRSKSRLGPTKKRKETSAVKVL